MWNMVIAGIVTVLAMGGTIAILGTVVYWFCEFLNARDQSERNRKRISEAMGRIQDLERAAQAAGGNDGHP